MENVKQFIVMRTKYPDGNGGLKKIRTGKMIAQGSHASMAWLSRRVTGINDVCIGDKQIKNKEVDYSKMKFTDEEWAWLTNRFTKVCLYVETEEELLDVYNQAKEAGLNVHLITDSGFTEFNNVPTKTCLGIGPHEAFKIDAITGKLPLF